MNGRIKIAMVLGTLIILIIGVSCITGETFTHNDAQHYKHNSISVDKINNSSFEKVSVEKTVPADSQSIKQVLSKVLKQQLKAMQLLLKDPIKMPNLRMFLLKK